MTTATILNLKGERERVSLPAPQWSGSKETSTGILTLAIFSGPRTGRKIHHYFSSWQEKSGRGVVGECHDEIDNDQYLTLCQKLDIDPAYIAAHEL